MVTLEKEIWAFTEQFLNNLEKFGEAKFKGTWLEPYFRDNLKSIYLQCKYIHEEFGNDSIIGSNYPTKKHLIVERLGKIIQKLLWKSAKISRNNSKPTFEWKGIKETLEVEEYLDILLHLFSSVFEFYISILKDKKMFDCVKLATNLGRTDLISKINKDKNLEQLYEELKNRTEQKYGEKINSLFNIGAYGVRCSCFHMDYTYKKEDNKVKIILNDSGTQEIELTELLKLSNDIFSRLNIYGAVPHFFREGKLPIN